jgi:hypothetical protein
MRCVYLATVALLGMTTLSALAQAPPVVDPATGARPGHVPGVGESMPQSNRASNIVPADTRSNIAPTLPSPAIGDNAGPSDYLKVARASLVAGRTGEAQQSLEMAETRALDRSVEQAQAGTPSDSKLVSQIGDARRALGDGNNAHAIELIDLALAG